MATNTARREPIREGMPGCFEEHYNTRCSSEGGVSSCRGSTMTDSEETDPMQSPTNAICKHYRDANGEWRPIILDPKGDQALMSRQAADRWLSEQRDEHRKLVACGEIEAQ